jgi:UPF0755 protein
MFRYHKKVYIIGVGLLFSLLLSYFMVLFAIDCFSHLPSSSSKHHKHVFLFPQGSSLRQAANKMQRLGWVKHANNVVLLARIRGISGKLHFGEYQVNSNMTVSSLLTNMFHARERIVHQITFIPGKTYFDMLDLLNVTPRIKNDITEHMLQKLTRAIVPQRNNPEGYFYPDTYNYTYGVRASTILMKAHRKMVRNLAIIWKNRDPGLPFDNSYQLLITASLVESEAQLPRERPLIASVIENRLRKGMYLQIDPTVIYGLHGKLGLPLSSKDLHFDTIYNTYLHKGLPPTPIDAPSLASLKAVAHPADSNYLYFVLSPKNNGGHVFSSTLKAHQHAVKEYRSHKES